MRNEITLVFLGKKDEVYTTSEIIAEHAQVQHHTITRLIQQHEDDFKEFGQVRFEIDAVKEARARGTKYLKPEMSAGDLEAVHKLTDTIKNIYKICMLEDGEEYSEAADGGDYGRGSSYANRGKHYVRGHYRRDGGRSEMMEHLEMAMDTATDQDRETIKRFMRQLVKA